MRHVGDPVAVVIAETLRQARDAAELVEVDYEVLPAVVDTDRGASSRRAAAARRGARATSATTGSSATRPRPTPPSRRRRKVAKLDLINNRLIPNAMEPRAAIGEYDRATDELTLYTTSQNPHVIRLLMGAFVLQHPRAASCASSRPMSAAASARRSSTTPRRRSSPGRRSKVGRPVKWTSERSRGFLSDAHGRDHVTHAELALDKDGKFLGAARSSTVANLGAYLSTFATCVPTYLYGTLLAGQYTTPAIYVRGEGGVHQHRAGRRLSRRRPPGGDLPARAHRRHGGARD